MLLERLDIDVYGPFGKKNLGPFSNEINAIWGPEGSGKTAIVDFIRGVMLGSEYAGNSATVGRVTWADHRGLYHCQRDTDGTQAGRLTTDFSPRDAAHADERFRHYGYHSRRPDAIPPALVDLVVAPDSRETSISRIFEAAATVGFQQAQLSAKPSSEIERIQLRIVDIDAQLNRDYQGTENRDDLEMRRRRLTTELETLERAAAPTEPAISTRGRSELENRLSAARAEAERLRYVEDELHDTIADIQDEIDHQRDVPEAQPHRWTINENYRLRLQDLDAQLVRWRRTLQEVKSLRERLELSVEDIRHEERRSQERRFARGVESQHETFDYLRSLEARIEQAQRHIDALAGSYDDGYYRSADNDSVARNLRAMQDELRRVRQGFSHSDQHPPRTRFDDEHAQLRRCEQELMTAIERLIAERSDLMSLASREHDVPFEQLSDAYGNWNPFSDAPHLRDWLVSEQCPPAVQASEAVHARRQRLQDELSGVRAELHRNEDALTVVVAEIDALQREISALPIHRTPVVDGDRMAQLRYELAEVRRRLEWLDSLEGIRRERGRLVEELRRLEAEGQRTESPLTACANHWLSRLTAGRMRSIELVGPGSYTEHVSTGREFVRVDGRLESDLSTDDRRTAGLALRMAICCLMNEDRTGIPIVIDDPLVHHNDHRMVARALTEFASGGNQVLVLTRSQPLVDDLSDQGAWTDALPPRTDMYAGANQGDMYDVNRFLDMAWRESHGLYDNPSRTASAGWHPTHSYPRRRSTRGYYEPKHREAAKGNYSSDDQLVKGTAFYLTAESHVDLAPSVDSVAAARLRGIGIESVGDLLTNNAENIASRVGLAGVNGNTIRRWQIESDLVCRVPGLRAFDSRVLVGCGVTRPEHLSQLHPTELLEKVERFLSTDLGRETLRSGTSDELSRLTTWIASASREVLYRNERPQDSRTVRRTRRVRTSEPRDTGSTRTVRTRRTRRSRDGVDTSYVSPAFQIDQDRDNGYEQDHEFEHDYDVDVDPASAYSVRKEIDYDGDGIADETIEYEYDGDGTRRQRRTRRSTLSGSSSSNGSSRSGSSSSSRSSSSGRSSRSSSSSRSSRSGSGSSNRSSRNGRSRSTGRGSSERSYERSERTPRESRSRSRRTTRTQRTDSGDRVERDVVAMNSSESTDEKTLRFYLAYDQPVEEAPSIGARMAERLEAVGVITVRDLMNADADELAEKLDHRRASAETIVEWQFQSNLMCTVPMLRGHDAQLLVAAEITEAEQLAECDASSLLDDVLPIANSTKGKRILRGGSKPDLEEVTDWITWANQRHTVRAA